MDALLDDQATTTWLDAELDRMWLIAERRLRRMVAAGVDVTGAPGMRAVDAILTVRRRGRGGPAAPDLAEVEGALAARGHQVAEARKGVALGALASRLGLRPIEIDVLVATFAPLVDPPLGELFQIVRGQGQRRGVDLALLGELFELDRRRRLELLEAIDADRPLVRWKLIALEGARETVATNRPLVASSDVVATLTGVRHLPPSLVPHAALRDARTTSLDELTLPAATRNRVEAMCRGFALHAADALPWVALWGPTGSGRRELATRIAGAAGRIALVFDPTTCAPDDLLARLHHAQREALIRGAALVVGPIADDMSASIARALRRYPDLVFLALTSAAPPRLQTERPVHELALAPLPQQEAAALWARQIATVAHAADLDLAPIVTGFSLTAGDITQAVAFAHASAQAQARTVEYADVRAGVEHRLRGELSGLVERVDGVHAWDELVLPDGDLDRLREFIGRKRNASIVYDTWGLAGRIRYGKGMIGLFSGPPGTGKTMIAGVIATELSMDLYKVDLSQVISKWAGETEKQLARIFDIAERTQAVLLFDEADSLFARRGEVEGGRDRFANLTVNYLLQRLERYPGVAILTTNKEESLDDALQRRLSLHLRLELPEVAERRRLWRSFLPPQLPGAAELDIEWLAQRFELSGGSIKNAAVRAAFLAAGDGSPVDLAVVVAAVERELDDMGRVVWQLPPAPTPVDMSVGIDDVILA
ncbi:MAG: ATP-binding protein [Deltaproteobacteria bacterium]|nr:ATP-binding protein [Deltaproteobacteria bacterium]